MRTDSEFNEIEIKLHMLMDAISNNEFDSEEILEEWLDDAAASFKAVLRKQLGNQPKREGKLRLSAMGKPACILQHEQMGTEGTRMPYNHIMRMLIGDSVEIITEVLMKAAKLNITGSKEKTEIFINGTRIPGEIDFEIDNKTYDVKSSSAWAFKHKWSKGFNELYHNDTFGYVAQLLGYAEGRGIEPGGWIVINKETGELKVVEYTPTDDQLQTIKSSLHLTERKLTNKLPFERLFEPETEYFRGKPTGNTIVPIACTFCPFMHSKECWSNAKLLPQAKSKAQDPKMVWYVDYVPEDNTE